MGDFNAIVGEEEQGKKKEDTGLAKNERGNLLQFCQSNKLFVINTWFKNPKRSRYTPKKPGNTGQNQIDSYAY